MDNAEDTEVWIVTTTVGSMEDARALAARVVEGGLAACVQLDAITESVYRWEGRLCQDPEVRLSIKTVASALEPLQALFARAHPYELPQFLAFPARASIGYAGWVRTAVAQRA